MQNTPSAGRVSNMTAVIVPPPPTFYTVKLTKLPAIHSLLHALHNK